METAGKTPDDDAADAAAWDGLVRELDAWAAAGRAATLWWRDDDAAEAVPALDRLIALADGHAVPLGLATVPVPATEALAERVDRSRHVAVIQHGFAHANHAPRGQGLGAWELGLHRGLAAVEADLAAGADRLVDLFGDRFVPVLAPPWNRIDEAVIARLPALGYRGLTAGEPRRSAHPVDGLTQVNAHADPIRWKGGARFKGVARSLGDLVEHLAARRAGTVDAEEPTGLLTHHLDTDAACWAYLDRLLATLVAHPAVRWLAVPDIWPAEAET